MTLSVIVAVQVMADRREKAPEARYYAYTYENRFSNKHTNTVYHTTNYERTILFVTCLQHIVGYVGSWTELRIYKDEISKYDYF